jgi:hypothetical protein
MPASGIEPQTQMKRDMEEAREEARPEQETGAGADAARPEGEAPQAEPKYFARWAGKSFLRTAGEVYFYKAAFVASILAIFFFLREGSWMAIVTFLVTMVIIMLELKDQPRDVDYEINIDGIKIDGRLYRFDDIHSFELGRKVCHRALVQDGLCGTQVAVGLQLGLVRQVGDHRFVGLQATQDIGTHQLAQRAIMLGLRQPLCEG